MHVPALVVTIETMPYYNKHINTVLPRYIYPSIHHLSIQKDTSHAFQTLHTYTDPGKHSTC